MGEMPESFDPSQIPEETANNSWDHWIKLILLVVACQED